MTVADFADRGETDPITRFTEDWQHCLRGERTDPPPIAEYIPDGTQVRLAVLTDLVRIDLRHRWDREGLGKRIAEYRKEFPEVEQSAELVDLLCEEFLARRRYGPLELTDFLAEYPELAQQVRARLTVYADDDDSADTERAAALVAGLTPGHRIDDFDLLTDLGTGALGRVFLAKQRSMQRLVAVRLSAGWSASGHSMAKLDHPNVVRVFDQRLVTATPATAPEAIASTRLVYMQYLPGGTAAGVLAQRRRGTAADGGALLSRAIDTAMEAKGEIRPADSSVRREIAALSWPETVAWIGRRLADALDYAEQHGVLHREIKPANVLFTAEGIPKLADFAVRTAAPRSLTNTIAVDPDSLPYRSPEQLAQLLDPAAPAPGPRSDIFSLGALLWKLLTGAAPFDDPPMPTDPDARAETFATMVRLREHGITDATLARLPADTPSALRRVLLGCLQADPHQRWSNGKVLAQQLDLCLDQRARDLIDPPPGSWRQRLRAWRIPLVVLAVLVPNVLASLYNIQHSRQLITNRLSGSGQHHLDIGTGVVNFVGFPLAAVVLGYLGRYLITVPHGLYRGVDYPPQTLRHARTDTILFGHWVVLVTFTLWMLAGISFPVVLYGSADNVTAADYAHFVAAHAVCGAIAVTYPFFLVTFYGIRCLYPMFLRYGEVGDADVLRLRRVRRRCGQYLTVAASIPLLAVAGATLLPPSELAQIIVQVRVLSIGSIIAFVISYLLFRAMERDLDALERVMTPSNVEP
ncbi:serine/threonine-protein kinase [Nocardia sp. NPDC050412]|uniref:serine/threonine-protein kinase n=1 Tax=Nocardia sp. NPDC050412 TaxID=3364320 RepID=UPI003788CE65